MNLDFVSLLSKLKDNVSLVFQFLAIRDPIETEAGLKAYLQWALNAGQAFNVDPKLLEAAQRVLAQPDVFASVLYCVRFVHGHITTPTNAVAGGGFAAGAPCIMLEDGSMHEIDESELREWMPFAATLQTFVAGIQSQFQIRL